MISRSLNRSRFLSEYAVLTRAPTSLEKSLSLFLTHDQTSVFLPASLSIDLPLIFFIFYFFFHDTVQMTNSICYLPSGAARHEPYLGNGIAPSLISILPR